MIFSRAAILVNSLHIECFPLTHDLNGFEPRIEPRHTLSYLQVLLKQFPQGLFPKNNLGGNSHQ